MGEAVKRAYAAGQDDETMEPLVLVDAKGRPIGRISDGDYIVFYNIRGEREIQLTQSFVSSQFDCFPRKQPLRVDFTTMIEYDPSLEVSVAFPPERGVSDTLSEVVSRNGLKQVKIVESEKSVHLTFYLNGKREEPFPGEERIIIPSVKDVKEFHELPEMRVKDVAEAVLEKIEDEQYDLIIANFANTDVVGHSEHREAILKAVNAVDTQTGRVVEAAQAKGMAVIVTADHGTVEKWLYSEGTIDTGHTKSPVPFVLVLPDRRGPVVLRDDGDLGDVAPTVLTFMGLEPPPAMTGRDLVVNGGPRLHGRHRVLLLILDGWGAREEQYGNLIAEAQTPVMDRLTREYPYTTLVASGEAVGLPEGSVGNSEAGHLHLGAGRRVYSDRVQIFRSIEDGSFYRNQAFLRVMKGVKKAGTALHLLGIVSFYSSHGSIDYLMALLRMAHNERVFPVYIHSMLGRRGERPEAGAQYVSDIDVTAREMGYDGVVSVIGRYWALDREKHWDRIERCYRMLVYGEGSSVPQSVKSEKNS
jgi:2,3-bisphosphoglycerate-independent phosphoglycerate mutase